QPLSSPSRGFRAMNPRSASVLAYINSLQLRTLPAIDADQDAGITDPTAPNLPEPEDDSSASTDQEVSTTVSTQNAAPSWSPSIPEPDPTKEPS
ncbi:MAG: hypothetical protein WCA40_12965, partial [Candidatus Acidiferrum sp.]